MTTNITRTFGRYIALPIVSAGIIGGAALGLAGMANAATPRRSRAGTDITACGTSKTCSRVTTADSPSAEALPTRGGPLWCARGRT
jgi:hypothetical protein